MISFPCAPKCLQVPLCNNVHIRVSLTLLDLHEPRGCATCGDVVYPCCCRRRKTKWYDENVKRCIPCIRHETRTDRDTLTLGLVIVKVDAHQKSTRCVYNASAECTIAPVLGQPNCLLTHIHVRNYWHTPKSSQLCPYDLAYMAVYIILSASSSPPFTM